MSRYNTIILNDVVNGEGVCVSFFVQGCPHHCPGCFNPETWDFLGGKKYTSHTKWEIIKAISDNDIFDARIRLAKDLGILQEEDYFKNRTVKESFKFDYGIDVDSEKNEE